MKINRISLIGIILGLMITGASFLLLNTKFFFFVMGVGIIVAVTPFVFSTIRETRIANEKEQMFLEFSRSLAESVKTGTPISKSIVNLKGKSYGVLSENIKKLANQIVLGIPLSTALQIFSKDVNNKTVSRAITLIGQAEKSGGDNGEILAAVTEAVSTSDKLKKERKAVISTLIVQGYIIFFVFLIIILVLQFKIIPMVSGIDNIGLASTEITSSSSTDQLEVGSAFLYLLLIQGFFSGLTIGKLSEKNLKAGIKHSFILMVVAFIVFAGANFFLG